MMKCLRKMTMRMKEDDEDYDSHLKKRDDQRLGVIFPLGVYITASAHADKKDEISEDDDIVTAATTWEKEGPRRDRRWQKVKKKL
jgi:hypothetical protein